GGTTWETAACSPVGWHLAGPATGRDPRRPAANRPTRTVGAAPAAPSRDLRALRLQGPDRGPSRPSPEGPASQASRPESAPTMGPGHGRASSEDAGRLP